MGFPPSSVEGRDAPDEVFWHHLIWAPAEAPLVKYSCNTEEVHRCIASKKKLKNTWWKCLDHSGLSVLDVSLTHWLTTNDQTKQCIHSIDICIDWFFLFSFFFDYFWWGNMKSDVNDNHSLKAKNKPKNWRVLLMQPWKPLSATSKVKGLLDPSAPNSSFNRPGMTHAVLWF